MKESFVVFVHLSLILSFLPIPGNFALPAPRPNRPVRPGTLDGQALSLPRLRYAL